MRPLKRFEVAVTSGCMTHVRWRDHDPPDTPTRECGGPAEGTTPAHLWTPDMGTERMGTMPNNKCCPKPKAAT
eukprot:4485996-Pyramimonas_sp.AAC.1